MASKYGRNVVPINEWMSANVSDEVKASRIPEEEWRWFDWNLYYPAETVGDHFKNVMVRGYVYDPHNFLGKNYKDTPEGNRFRNSYLEFLCKDVYVLWEGRGNYFLKVAKFAGGSRFEIVGLNNKDEELFFRLQWNP